MRDPDQHRPIERIDWDRYTGDRDYRRIIDAQQEMQQRQAARERDRGSGLER